jgi:hypothetical protein
MQAGLYETCNDENNQYQNTPKSRGVFAAAQISNIDFLQKKNFYPAQGGKLILVWYQNYLGTDPALCIPGLGVWIGHQMRPR